MDLALSSMLKQTVTLAPYVSMDDNGKPVYAAAVPYTVFVRISNAMLRQPDGKVIQGRYSVLFTGAPVFSATPLEDQLTMPDGSQPSLLRIDGPFVDEGGQVSHTRVITG